MAQNFIYDGDYIEFPILAAVTAGTPVLYQNKLMVPLSSSSVVGTKVAHATEGVWVMPKHTGEAWAVGQELYWDDTNKYLTTTSTSNTLQCWATQPALSAATTGEAKFHE